MFREKTTFVIGAGASVEYADKDRNGNYQNIFPVGSTLRSKIAEGSWFDGRIDFGSINSGDDVVYEWLKRKHKVSTQGYIDRINASREIARKVSDFGSIDECLDHIDNPVVSEMGKVFIARYISEAENKCSLTTKQTHGRVSLDAIGGSWLEQFTRILLTGRKDPTQIGEEVKIICFNYDRCIEFYLINAICSRYDLKWPTAYDIVKQIAILHPYGTLGDLPREHPHASGSEVPFGADTTRFDPWSMIEKLKTYTERENEDADLLERMKRAIAHSNNLVFLGFGFLSENLNLLSSKEQVSGPSSVQARVMATGIGQFEESDEMLRWKIFNLFSEDASMRDLYSSRRRIHYNIGCADVMKFNFHNLLA